MKRVVIGVGLALAIVATANLFPGRAQEAGSRQQQPPSNGTRSPNPLRVALLRWYEANLTTSFKVGNAPDGIAFDGENMWVANYTDGTVTKIHASDGTNLGTFNVGTFPFGIAFDGANIWVANPGDNTVSKLRASDGKTLGTFGVGKAPWQLAFDGSNMWVVNAQSSSVTKLRVSDGQTLGTFPVNGAVSIAFDGTYMWVPGGPGGAYTVTRLALDGTVAGSFPLDGQPLGLAFDGANIWVTSRQTSHGALDKLRASDGKHLGTFSIGDEPWFVAFDGANIWVTTDPIVEEVRTSDGAVIGKFGGINVPYGNCI